MATKSLFIFLLFNYDNYTCSQTVQRTNFETTTTTKSEEEKTKDKNTSFIFKWKVFQMQIEPDGNLLKMSLLNVMPVATLDFQLGSMKWVNLSKNVYGF